MVAANYTVIKFHSDNKRQKRGFRLHFSEIPRSGKCRREPNVIQLYGKQSSIFNPPCTQAEALRFYWISKVWTPSKLIAVI